MFIIVLIILVPVGAYFLARGFSEFIRGDRLAKFQKDLEAASRREPKELLPDSDLSATERETAQQTYRMSSRRNRRR